MPETLQPMDAVFPLLSALTSDMVVGAAMAVMPVPRIPQSETATVVGQVTR